MPTYTVITLRVPLPTDTQCVGTQVSDGVLGSLRVVLSRKQQDVKKLDRCVHSGCCGGQRGGWRRRGGGEADAAWRARAGGVAVLMPSELRDYSNLTVHESMNDHLCSCACFCT